MATKTIRIDILENNLILEVELEETIQAKTLVSRLKNQAYLNSDIVYFVKTVNGDTIDNFLTVKSFPSNNNIIITEDEKWKQVFPDSFDPKEITTISHRIALHDDTYWLFPLFPKVDWTDQGKRCHLFEIKGITLVNGDYLTTYLLAQYSLIDEILFSAQNIHEFLLKIKQIMTDTLKVEIAANNITSSDFFNDVNEITIKMREYITAHLELNWNSRIDSVSILGFKHNRNEK